MTVANGNISTYPSNLKGQIEMALRYCVPLPGLFYGLFWVVRRSLRNRQKCRPVAQCFPVQRPLPQRPVQPVPYGFVPAQRERVAVEGGPFGSDRYV